MRRPAEDAPAPPAAPGHLEELAVGGFSPSLVWVPEGAPGAVRPLLVVAHGAGGRPEPHCEIWSARVGARGFVLCLRGKATGSGRAYYPDHYWLGRALDAAVGALDARHGARAPETGARSGPRVEVSLAAYAGFSQGAVMGALALMTRRGRWARLLFVEAQQNDWSVAAARGWWAAGGRRVALVCGIDPCARAASTSEWVLRRGGVEVFRRHVRGGGHTYTGALAPVIDEAFEWLVSDDARWAGGGV